MTEQKQVQSCVGLQGFLVLQRSYTHRGMTIAPRPVTLPRNRPAGGRSTRRANEQGGPETEGPTGCCPAPMGQGGDSLPPSGQQASPLGKYELPGHIQRLRRKNTHRALKPEAAPAGLAAAGAVTPHVWQVWDADCSGAALGLKPWLWVNWQSC